MQQPTIFEDHFGFPTIKHRRLLLPLWAKISCWIAMVSGLSISIGITLYIRYILENFGPSLDMNQAYKLAFLTEYTYLILLGLVIFIVPLIIWLGKKWAIRINWILSALFILPVISSLLLSYPFALSNTVPVFILLPLWIALARVQKKWENTVVVHTGQ